MELVLNTFGTTLSRDRDGFVVVHKDGEQHIPPISISSIQITKGAQISSDAVLLAIENEIEVLFTTRSGEPAGRVWSPRYGSISTIRKGQLNFSQHEPAVKWIKNVITTKISNQQALISIMASDGTDIDYVLNRL